jgi:hypothetical protein
MKLVQSDPVTLGSYRGYSGLKYIQDLSEKIKYFERYYL